MGTVDGMSLRSRQPVDVLCICQDSLIGVSLIILELT